MSQANLPSVILFRLDNASRKALEERLATVLAQCEAALTAGAIISVRSDAFRVRKLPLS